MATQEYTETDYHAFKDPELGAKDYQQYLSDNIQDYDERIVKRGSLSNRPAAEKSGRIYISTDSGEQTVYLDTGNAWVAIAGTQMGNQTIRVNEVHADDGTATDPSYTFDSDTDTGMYSPAAGSLRFSTNGGFALEITSGQRVDAQARGRIKHSAASFVSDSTFAAEPGLIVVPDSENQRGSAVHLVPSSDPSGTGVDSDKADIHWMTREGEIVARVGAHENHNHFSIYTRDGTAYDGSQGGHEKRLDIEGGAPSSTQVKWQNIYRHRHDSRGTGVDHRHEYHVDSGQVARQLYYQGGTSLDLHAEHGYYPGDGKYKFRVDSAAGTLSDVLAFNESGVEIPNSDLDLSTNRINSTRSGTTPAALNIDIGSDSWAWAVSLLHDTEPDIAWERHATESRAFTVRNDATGTDLLTVADDGIVRLPENSLEIAVGNDITDGTNSRLEVRSGKTAIGSPGGGSGRIALHDHSAGVDKLRVQEGGAVEVVNKPLKAIATGQTDPGHGGSTGEAPLHLTANDPDGIAALIQPPGDPDVSATDKSALLWLTRDGEQAARFDARESSNAWVVQTRTGSFDGTFGSIADRFKLEAGKVSDDQTFAHFESVRGLNVKGRSHSSSVRADLWASAGADTMYRFREGDTVMASIRYHTADDAIKFWLDPGDETGLVEVAEVAASGVTWSRNVTYDTGTDLVSSTDSAGDANQATFAIDINDADTADDINWQRRAASDEAFVIENFSDSSDLLTVHDDGLVDGSDESRIGTAHQAPNAHIPMSEIPDGDHIEIVVQVPTDSELLLWAWGAQDDSQNAPTGLDVELVDASTGSTLTSENTKHTTGTPIWTHTASDPIALRLSNGTGSSINASAFFSYTIE